jgi:hypothetical protein
VPCAAPRPRHVTTTTTTTTTPARRAHQRQQTVQKLAMLDNGTAQILWTLSGQLGTFALSIPMTSLFELNLLTGRVLSHK